MDKTQLTRGPLTQTSPMHVSPNVSPPQGMWPMTSMPMQSQSPAGLHGMAPQGQSPDRHGISSQGPGISPLHQRPNMSPSMGDMMMRPPSNSPPQMGYSPQHTHISPQHIVPSPPRPVQHIAPRQPVLGQLMVITMYHHAYFSSSLSIETSCDTLVQTVFVATNSYTQYQI